jgi:signal peptidase II
MFLRFWPFLVAAAVFVLDRSTKWWIETSVTFWDMLPVIPGLFQIVHTRNRGIAFGVFSDSDSRFSNWLLVLFSAAILAFVATLLWRHPQLSSAEHWTLRLGLGLVLGGAAGNVFDRIVLGSVTDFLDFYHGKRHFPIFNVADSAITVGAILLLVNLRTQGKAGAVESSEQSN